MGGGDLHVGLAVRDGLAELVIDAAGHELGEGADERDLARDRQAGGRADHVGLGDAALDETVGEFRRESVHLQGALEIGGEGEHLRVFPPRFEETGTESAAGVLLSGIDILAHAKSLLTGFHLTVSSPRRTVRRSGPFRATCRCRP